MVFLWTISRYERNYFGDLGYFHVFGDGLDLKGNFTDSLDGEWGHHCVTWAASSQAFRVYYQGELMGNKLTASGTKLEMGGYMALGNDFDFMEQNLQMKMRMVERFSKQICSTES